MDLVLQTDRFIYVMEFKLDGTAEEALRQINEKRYAQPFELDDRKLFKVGVNFSAETRNIEKWIVESKNPRLITSRGILVFKVFLLYKGLSLQRALLFFFLCD